MACRPRRINITESASRLSGAGAEATRAQQRKLPRPLSFCDRICYTGNHLKLCVLISPQRSDCRCRFNAAPAARIRDYHTFDIFNNIAARLNYDPVRQFAENRAGLCRAVSERDRFCAPHGADQLPLQDLYICLIDCAAAIHLFLSFLKSAISGCNPVSIEKIPSKVHCAPPLTAVVRGAHNNDSVRVQIPQFKL